MIYLISLAFVVVILCVIKIVEINGLLRMVEKDRSHTNKVNELEKNYEFIKGLY